MNLLRALSLFMIIILIPTFLFNCGQKPAIPIEASSQPKPVDIHDYRKSFAWINQASGKIEQIAGKDPTLHAFMDNAKKCLSSLKRSFEILPHSHQVIGDSLSALSDNIQIDDRSGIIGITLTEL